MTIEAFSEALKARVVPVLREHGFYGRFPHFYRVRGQVIDLLSFSAAGRGFVIELGTVPNDRGLFYRPRRANAQPLLALRATDLPYSQRARLLYQRASADGRTVLRVWQQSRPADQPTAEEAMVELLRQAERWWRVGQPGPAIRLLRLP